jgi:hypothetical protein
MRSYGLPVAVFPPAAAPVDSAATRDLGGPASRLLRRARVQLTYVWRHGRFARLSAPTLLTEHIQARKLGARDPRMAPLADKVAVKAHVAALLGPEWVTPTLWRGDALPDQPVWPMPFVVKSRHGCGHIQVVRNVADYARARKKSSRWMRCSYGRWLDEWIYRDIPRGLLVEPFIGSGPHLPVDYKLFVFGGRVRCIQVHLERETRHRWIVFDRAWTRLSRLTADVDPSPPPSLAAMIAAAERLGASFDFVRADFYDAGGHPRFGELTFFPGSGLERVEPPSLDWAMGEWWTPAMLAPGAREA